MIILLLFIVCIASDANCFTNSSTYVVENEVVPLSCYANGASYIPAAMSMNMEWSGVGCPSAAMIGSSAFVSSSVSIQVQLPMLQSCDCTTHFSAPHHNQLSCATNAPTYSYTWSSPSINVSCKCIGQYIVILWLYNAPIHSKQLPNAPDCFGIVEN